ncbi:MAG: TetR/AcrR family transcriptional regulator [Jatrophihabitans sp.]|uniref:TetR/AcrR family transcriptional regulator n=1 Tax=Jatrophihabitans sp. TaxID=1932789 RepID=UPI003F7CEF54
MSEVVRPYRGVSADARRADRRARLLEAGREQVGAVGVTAVTVDAVCARAGLSKRYFYEAFPDRDALLVAVLEEVLDSVRAAIVAVLDPRDRVETRIERTVATLVSALTADPRAARLFLEAPRLSSLETRRIAEFDVFTDLLVRHVLDLDGHDPAARTATLLIVAGTTEVVSRWLAGDLDIDRTGLVAAVVAVGRAVSAVLDNG